VSYPPVIYQILTKKSVPIAHTPFLLTSKKTEGKKREKIKENVRKKL
jgi:hypothetical protein